MRAGGNPWLLRLADADGTDEVVLKTGDVTTDLDRRQLITTVAALELAADHALPTPRLIAADLDGGAAGTMAVLMNERASVRPADRGVAQSRFWCRCPPSGLPVGEKIWPVRVRLGACQIRSGKF